MSARCHESVGTARFYHRNLFFDLCNWQAEIIVGCVSFKIEGKSLPMRFELLESFAVARSRQAAVDYLRAVAARSEISVEAKTLGNLEPDGWRVLVDLVRLNKSSAPQWATALPSEIVPEIEETVRAHFAKPIAHTENPSEIEA